MELDLWKCWLNCLNYNESMSSLKLECMFIQWMSLSFNLIISASVNIAWLYLNIMHTWYWFAEDFLMSKFSANNPSVTLFVWAYCDIHINMLNMKYATVKLCFIYKMKIEIKHFDIYFVNILLCKIKMIQFRYMESDTNKIWEHLQKYTKLDCWIFALLL